MDGKGSLLGATVWIIFLNENLKMVHLPRLISDDAKE
jgi:hypothetical protein